jgi:antiviral helicase SLH1
VQRRYTWALVIVPKRSVAAELLSMLRPAGNFLGVSVENRTSSNTLTPPERKAVYVVTAKNLFQAFFHSRQVNNLRGLGVVICEGLDQLTPNYELAISLLRHATQSFPTRFIGMSNSLNDPRDLADWLSVDSYGLHSFKPRDRDQSLTFEASSFSIPYSSSLLKAMAKPAHAAIKGAERAIVFVPSRGNCRAVALDLLTQSALEAGSTAGYLPDTVSDNDLEIILHRLADSPYYDFLSKGVSFFHEGIDKKEQNIILQLFLEGVLRVLIVPREACWSLPVRAEVVIVMGCQYLQSGPNGTDRQVRDFELIEVVRMQGQAVRQYGDGRFYLFCQPEAKDTYTRFLNDGLPLESSLLETPELETWFKAQMEGPSFNEKQALEMLSFTYLARRIETNPSYYGCMPSDENLSRAVGDIFARIRND